MLHVSRYGLLSLLSFKNRRSLSLRTTYLSPCHPGHSDFGPQSLVGSVLLERVNTKPVPVQTMRSSSFVFTLPYIPPSVPGCPVGPTDLTLHRLPVRPLQPSPVQSIRDLGGPPQTQNSVPVTSRNSLRLSSYSTRKTFLLYTLLTESIEEIKEFHKFQ